MSTTSSPTADPKGGTTAADTRPTTFSLQQGRITVTTVTPAYWRATLSHPPLNLFDPEMLADWAELLDCVEAEPNLRVIVIDSSVPDYFIAHIDLLRWTETADSPYGAPYTAWPAMVTRLVESPVISIATIRGRVRGHGNELALACDMRFASIEYAAFGQLEVALTTLPGGGGIEWLTQLCGRSRALEIVLSSADFNAQTASQYGWINQALPDDQLDLFVDQLARRIAEFDADAVQAAKIAVNNYQSAPSEFARRRSNDEFHRLARLSQQHNKPHVPAAFSHGLQQPGDFEFHLGDHLADLERVPL